MSSSSSSFPAGSIGRSASGRVAPSLSLDAASTTAPSSPVSVSSPSSVGPHPLLSPPPQLQPQTFPSPAAPDSPTAPTSPFPYMPRRKTPGGSITSLPPPSSSSALTSAISTPSISIQSPLFSQPVASTSALDSHGDIAQSASISAPSSPSASGPAGALTERLKLTNLKAEAQKGVGLGNDSLGMKMLEGIVARDSDKAWDEVMELILVKKATLLLPFAASSSSLEITPDIVREHLVLCNAGAKDGSIVVTLSGLIARMDSDSLTFLSFLPTDGPVMASLLDPASRAQTLARLSVPVRPVSVFRFPSLTPLLYSSSLPIPPLATRNGPPSLPTRPRVPSGSGQQARTLANPFAGLFGRATRPATPDLVPRPPTPPLVTFNSNSDDEEVPHGHAEGEGSPSHNREDSMSLDARDADKPASTDTLISAWGIDRPLKRAELEKAVGKALRSWADSQLEGLPSSVSSATKRLMSFPHPSASHSRLHPPTASPAPGRGKPLPAPTLSTIPPPSYLDLEATSSTYQTFFSLVFEELYAHHNNPLDESASDADRDRRERDIEKKVADGVDQVESVLTSVSHNLLFCPPSSNDSKHDEALASRIAALNMLDLSLDHLGVITTKSDGSRDETIASGLEVIVQQVGEELEKLQSTSCLTPKAKSAVLVRAHKIVIDGLRALPPIRVRPEGERYDPEAQRPRPSSPAPSSTGSDSLPPAIRSPRSSSELEDNSAAQLVESRVPPDGADSEKTPKLGEFLERPKIGRVPTLTLESDDDERSSEEERSSAVEDALGSSVLLKPEPVVEESTAVEQASLAAESGGGPSGADLLLPIIIFSVVRSNPSRLVSHLLYIQRYRASTSFSGEASYALVNVTAVVEFLENVDPGTLGLGGSDKVFSTELPPIDSDLQKDLASISSSSTTKTGTGPHSRLRALSSVGELASSGLTNVANTGLGALRSLMTTGQATVGAAAEGLLVQVPGLPSHSRPAMPSRKTSGFSIASLTASVAGMGSKERLAQGSTSGGGSAGQKNEWGAKREMVDVSSSSRAGSMYERSEDGNDDSDRERSSDLDDSDEGEPAGRWRADADARSVRSVRSVSSYRSGAGSTLVVGSPSAEKSERMSISERFARLAGGAGSPSFQDSALPGSPASMPKANPLPMGGSSAMRSSASSTHSRRASLLGGTPYIPPASFSVTSPLTSPTEATRPSSERSLSSAPVSSGSIASPSSRPALPSSWTPPLHPIASEEAVAPPIDRYLTCEPGELRVGEIAALLQDYRRLAATLRQVGVWD